MLNTTDYSITEDKAVGGLQIPINKEYEELRAYNIFKQFGKSPESTYKIVLQGVIFGKSVKVRPVLTPGTGTHLQPDTAGT